MAELNLAGNYLHRLPEEVTSLLHLRAINLSRNRFRRFPEPLATVTTLETIDLEENEITGERVLFPLEVRMSITLEQQQFAAVMPIHIPWQGGMLA